jgi:hypothetical protein
MSPAHPWYVGRGDDTCGGEVVYSMQEIRKLLSSQPDDMKLWLTTSQMGWALTQEENEVVNEKDERDGNPVARQLAPMISTFMRAQWESGELEDIEHEKRRILEEAIELDDDRSFIVLTETKFSVVTYGVSGRRRRSRPMLLTNGLGNHPKVETT